MFMDYDKQFLSFNVFNSNWRSSLFDPNHSIDLLELIFILEEILNSLSTVIDEENDIPNKRKRESRKIVSNSINEVVRKYFICTKIDKSSTYFQVFFKKIKSKTQ